MDSTVPFGATILLKFIAKTEVSRDFPEAYEVIYNNKQSKLSKPLTRMTLDEVIAAGSTWSRNHGSSAAGAYQFMRATLVGLKKELNLPGSMLLDGNLQDRLGYHLLKRRGYLAFMTGAISESEFAKRLAQEWASFPVLIPTKGQQRNLSRGQSYYAGDGLNKALIKPEQVELILRSIKTVKPPAPTPEPMLAGPSVPETSTKEPVKVEKSSRESNRLVNVPETKKSKAPYMAILVGGATAIATAFTASIDWLSTQACQYLNLFCG